MVVNHSNGTKLHSENVERCFYDNTYTKGGKMAKGRIACNTNSSFLDTTSSTKA